MQVTWSNGATASGSSGSPLIDIDSRKVVGVLTGGFASCQDSTGPDYYGRLSAVSLPSYLSSCYACIVQLCQHLEPFLITDQEKTGLINTVSENSVSCV